MKNKIRITAQGTQKSPVLTESCSNGKVREENFPAMTCTIAFLDWRGSHYKISDEKPGQPFEALKVDF